ncbi:hypothetical protein CLV62_1462 [Dysgonomonas alginatilytica]|uniref:Virulence RhuM family protein n=1 Tax=Dysgonomonas alginatilytica TaxID=1605892 RepID=A0A2V3PHK2_9BACT|nr:hypothetical protein [Dysgonomonas alginatilytica]PXV58451.1 hypothetical protein CLV62_1462 [Dysgonomonas alginatilytica]
MKTTDKGKLAIVTDHNSNLQIIFEPVNNTVWLHKSELPSLLGVTVQAIHACLNAIRRENAIDVEQTCRYDLYVSGKRVCYDIREVNLKVIIAMAFRIHSPRADMLIEWFIGQCLKPKLYDFPLCDTQQNYSLN